MQNDRNTDGGFEFCRLADKEPEAEFTRSEDLSETSRKEPWNSVHEILCQLGLAREEIRKSKGLLQCALDGISDPLIMVGKDFKVRVLNKAATEYYRASREEVIGKFCYEVFLGRAEPCKPCNMGNALCGKKPVSFQRTGFQNPSRLEQVNIHPLDDGYAEGDVIIHISDINEQAQNGNELILANKLISLGVLVSGVAHEINNPNNLIMLNTPILMDAWKSIEPIIENYYKENGDFVMGGLNYSEMRVELPGLISGIVEGSRRIKRIVEDLKAYARHDDTGPTQNVDVKNAIESSIRLVDNLIRKSTDNFSIECGENLPLIRGNIQRIEQVVINLIQNACQAVTKKEQRISVTCLYDEKKNGVFIEVADEGIGIPEEAMPHIMDPFFTTKRGYGGTGLGLSVCSNIVKAHHGTIEVRSREGKGSVFRVFLPVSAKREPVRILVVDDDEILRKSMVGILEANEDYLVQEASNGAEAFLLMGHRLPDLLILDILMPDMDGVEVCRLLKEREELSKIKVIVVTGLPDSPKGKRVAGMGFKNIMSKPFKPMNFISTVTTTLEDAYIEGIKRGR
ncbi:MAG: ATP-binding protein [Nitrospirota bacterium]